MRRYNICVLISGSGTNLQALIDACKSLPSSSPSDSTTSSPPSIIQVAQISHVISNRKNAYGLVRARDNSIPTTYHNLLEYKRRQPSPTGEADIQKAREEYDRDLATMILSHTPAPDLVVCAGWMHILSPAFFEVFQPSPSPGQESIAAAAATSPEIRPTPIINLHPALPGAFDGANAIARAWGAFQRGDITATGVMIHEVIPEVDQGPVVVQELVKCQIGETESDLETRIHEVEWRLIVRGVEEVLHRISRDGPSTTSE